MRNQLIDELVNLARVDERIVLLTADLGFGVVEKFRDAYPTRFFNVGVAEQGMISVATGLAHRGFTPYCYSIATFATLRGLEFIRNGPVAHRLPVRIIGIGPGFDYENDGLTHYALDDVAVMRIQPGMTIWAPSDTRQLQVGLRKIQNQAGPAYLRIPRKSPSTEISPIPKSDINRGSICVLSFGDSSLEAEAVVAEIRKLQHPDVCSFSINWIDDDFESEVSRVLSRFDVTVCVENHFVRGGFGSAVLEAASNTGNITSRIILSGVKSLPIGRLGSRRYLNNAFASDPQKIAATAVTAANRSR